MSGAGGEEVGRISIRVVPNLDQFRAQMQAELEKWDGKEVHIKVVADGVEKVKAQVANAAKDVKANVKAEANTNGLRRKIKSEVTGIKARVRVDVDTDLSRFERRLAGAAENAVSKYEPNLNLTVQDENLRRQVEAKLSELKGLSALPVAVDPEIATQDKIFLKAELDKLLATLEAHARANKVRIWLEAESSSGDAIATARKFQDDLVDAQRKINEARRKPGGDLDPVQIKDFFNRAGDYAQLKVDLDFQEAELKRQAWAAAAAADRVTQRVKLEPDPDLSGFALAKAKLEAMFANMKINLREKKITAADLLPDVSEVGTELSKLGPKAASSLPSLLSFGGILLVIAGAIAVVLPPLLALGAGLVTLTPGLLAFVAPLGAIALGLDGIKKAATNAGLFTDSNGEKKGGGTIGAALDAIKQKVSDTFEKTLTPAFEKLGNIFQNTDFQNGMVSVADGLSKMASGFIDAVTSSSGMSNIQSILNNIGTGLTNAAPGVRDFTEAILELVQGISTKFPGLGKWFSDWMAGFREDMVDMTKPGEDGLSRLDLIIANVRRSIEGLTGIFQAFWNQGLKDIQDPSFGQGMTKFFDSVRDFVTNTLPSLSEGFKTIANLMDTLSPLFKAFGVISNGMGIFTNPGETVSDMVKRSEAVKKAGGSLMEQFKAAVTGVGAPEVFDGLPEQASETGKKAGAAMNDSLKSALTGGGLQGTGGLTGVITNPAQVQQAQQAGQQVGTGLTDGMKSVLSGQGGNAVATSLTGVLTQVETQVAAVGPKLQESLTAATTPLLALPAQLSTVFQTVGAAITGSFALLVSSVFTMSQQIATALSSNFAQLPGLVTNGLSGAVAAASGGGQQIVVGITTPLTQLSGIFTSTFANLVGVVTSAMGQLVQAITVGSQQAVQTVSAIPGQMAGAISAGANALVVPGQALMAGLKQGIMDGLRDVLAYASTIAGQIAAVKGPLPKDRKELIPAGVALMEGLGDGLDQGMTPVLDKAKAMAKAIFEAFKETFGSAPALNLNFSTMDSSMGSIASSAKSFSDSMGSALPAVKPGKIDAATQSQLDQLKIQKEQLDVQASQLKAEKNMTGDKGQKGVIQQQLDQLNIQKQTLEAQIAQLNYQGKYESSVGETKDLWEGMNQKIVDGVSNVGQGVMQSFASDLGISGNGALSTLGQQALQFGSQFIFNVANADDAIAVQQNQQRREALSYGG